MENRIHISFEVDDQQLQNLNKAMTTLKNFTGAVEKVAQSSSKFSKAYEQVGREVGRTNQAVANMGKLMSEADKAMTGSRFTMNHMEQSQKKLQRSLEKYNKDVRVSVKDNGRLSASFTTIKGEQMKLGYQFDTLKGKFTQTSKEVVSVSNRATELKKKMEQTRKEIEKWRSLKGFENLKPPSTAEKAWDVYNQSLLKGYTVLDGTIDKHGKFKQTLINTTGEVKKIEGHYERATGALKEFGDKMSVARVNTERATKAQMAQAGYSRDYVNKLGHMADSMKGLNKYTLSWAEAMQISATRMIQWGVAGSVIFGIQNAFRQLLTTIIEVDTQMTELKKVMDSSTDFDAMLQNSTDIAVEFGRKITDINEAMIEFGRQGLDESQIDLMARATTLMANVGDLDAGESASRLTGILTVFKKDFAEATDVVDRFNEVQNNYATTVDILTESVKRSGGTAETFGVELERVIGYTTAIGEATRESGNVIGNSLKTVFSRVTTVSGAMDRLYEIGIDVFDPVTKDARPVQDILDDLYGKWDTLTESQKQNIGVHVAGRYQVSRFLALMDNYDTALDSAKTSTEAYGSAQKENETYMDSFRAKINILWASLQELAITLGESGVGKALGAFLILTTNMVQGANDLIERFDAWTLALIPLTAGLGAFIYQARSMRTIMNGVGGDIGLFTQTVGAVNPQVQTFGRRLGMGAERATVFASAVGRVTGGLRTMAMVTVANPLFWLPIVLAGIFEFAGRLAQARREQEKFAQQAKTSTEEFEQFKDAISEGTVDTFQINKYTEKLSELEDQMKSLDGVAKSYNAVQETKAVYAKNIEATGQYARATQMLKENLERQSKASADTADATKVLSGTQQDALANLGIYVGNYSSLSELMEAVEGKHYEVESAVKEAKEAMQKATEEAVLPSVDAHVELADSIDESTDALETAIGITDDYITQLQDALIAYQLLHDQKGLTPAQDKVLEASINTLTDAFGYQEDQLKNNIGTIDDKILKMGEEKKAFDELVEKIRTGEADLEEIRNFSAGVIERNEDRKRIEMNKTKRVAEENKKAEEKRIEEQKKTMEKFRITMTEEYGIMDQTVENHMINTDGSFKTMEDIYKDLGISAEKSNEQIRKEWQHTTKNLEQEGGKAEKAIRDVDDEWNGLKRLFRTAIKGTIKMSITGIFGGLFGSGGEIDGDKVRQEVMASGGGSIAGNGYGGLRFTSGFGIRTHPITGQKKFHAGIDLAGPMGTPIRARRGGHVVSSGYAGSLGNLVEIMGSDGLLYRYGHNSSLNVSAGQFVPAGSIISKMGSTGDSTGSHLHFEVRRNGVAINPTNYYHSGGVVDKKPRSNEVDARLQVGEMVLTKKQQGSLFKMLGGTTVAGQPNHTYHTGGIVGGIGGSGGSNYTIRQGDTLSELAVRFNTTVKALMELNKNIKDANRIYAGNTLVIKRNTEAVKNSKPSYSSFSNPSKGDFQERMSRIDYLENIGWYNESNSSWALSNNVRRSAKTGDDKKSYNLAQLEIFKGMSDLKRMEGWFKKAKLFMTSKELKEVKDSLKEIVTQNYVDKIGDQTTSWLDNFNNGVSKAHNSVTVLLDAFEQAEARQVEENKNNYTGRYTDNLYKNLGINFDGDMTETEKMEQQLAELEQKIRTRAEENALLDYRLSTTQDSKRLNALRIYMNELREKIHSTRKGMESNGVSKDQINDTLKPLQERIQEVKAEYDALDEAMKGSSDRIEENNKELKGLASAYEALKQKLASTEDKREFTDGWGNIVRDAENNIKYTTQQAETLLDTLQSIKRESGAISASIPQSQSVTGVNANGVQSNSLDSENRTYTADTTVTRHVSYHIHVGNMIASDSEAKEFAMYLDRLVTEEKERDQN